MNLPDQYSLGLVASSARWDGGLHRTVPARQIARMGADSMVVLALDVLGISGLIALQ